MGRGRGTPRPRCRLTRRIRRVPDRGGPLSTAEVCRPARSEWPLSRPRGRRAHRLGHHVDEADRCARTSAAAGSRRCPPRAAGRDRPARPRGRRRPRAPARCARRARRRPSQQGFGRPVTAVEELAGRGPRARPATSRAAASAVVTSGASVPAAHSRAAVSTSPRQMAATTMRLVDREAHVGSADLDRGVVLRETRVEVDHALVEDDRGQHHLANEPVVGLRRPEAVGRAPRRPAHERLGAIAREAGVLTVPEG